MVFIALRIRWLDSITDSMDLNLSILWETVEDRGTWHLQSKGSQRVWHNLATEQPEIALSIWQLLQGFMCGWVALGDEAHELLQSQIETNHYGCTIHVKPYFLWPLPFYFSLLGLSGPQLEILSDPFWRTLILWLFYSFQSLLEFFHDASSRIYYQHSNLKIESTQ